MARRRTSNGRRSNANRRRLFWARRTELNQFQAADLAQSNNLLEDFEGAYGADLFGFTITRIVGFYTWWAPNTTATSTTFTVSAGIRVDDESEIAGSTDTEQVARLPINDQFVDWMYARNNLGATQSTSAPTGPDVPFQISRNMVELDLRSQRRLDELGQSLFFFHGLNASPGDDVFFWYDLNILCKRP